MYKEKKPPSLLLPSCYVYAIYFLCGQRILLHVVHDWLKEHSIIEKRLNEDVYEILQLWEFTSNMLLISLLSYGNHLVYYSIECSTFSLFAEKK